MPDLGASPSRATFAPRTRGRGTLIDGLPIHWSGYRLLLSRKSSSRVTIYFRTFVRTFESMLCRGSNICVKVIGRYTDQYMCARCVFAGQIGLGIGRTRRRWRGCPDLAKTNAFKLVHYGKNGTFKPVRKFLINLIQKASLSGYVRIICLDLLIFHHQLAQKKAIFRSYPDTR